jgi:hypothetical protein
MTICKNNMLEKRIRMIMDRLGYSQTQMASKLDMQPQNFNKHLLPEGAPNKRDPENLTSKLIKIGVSLDWFYTGKGEMFLSDTKEGTPIDPKVEKANKHFMEAVRLMMEAIEEKKTGKTDPEDESEIDTAVFSRMLDQAKNHYAAGPAPDLSEDQIEDLERLH